MWLYVKIHTTEGIQKCKHTWPDTKHQIASASFIWHHTLTFFNCETLWFQCRNKPLNYTVVGWKLRGNDQSSASRQDMMTNCPSAYPRLYIHPVKLCTIRAEINTSINQNNNWCERAHTSLSWPRVCWIAALDQSISHSLIKERRWWQTELETDPTPDPCSQTSALLKKISFCLLHLAGLKPLNN